MNRYKQKEFSDRRNAVVVSLNSIGEGKLASDFLTAEGKEGFESCEFALREALKRGPIDVKRANKRAKVLGNAIVEAQLLPHLGE